MATITGVIRDILRIHINIDQVKSPQTVLPELHNTSDGWQEGCLLSWSTNIISHHANVIPISNAAVLDLIIQLLYHFYISRTWPKAMRSRIVL